MGAGPKKCLEPQAKYAKPLNQMSHNLNTDALHLKDKCPKSSAECPTFLGQVSGTH